MQVNSSGGYLFWWSILFTNIWLFDLWVTALCCCHFFNQFGWQTDRSSNLRLSSSVLRELVLVVTREYRTMHIGFYEINCEGHIWFLNWLPCGSCKLSSTILLNWWLANACQNRNFFLDWKVVSCNELWIGYWVEFTFSNLWTTLARYVRRRI